MAEIKVPIQINLPDDWIEQIVNRLRNDPESEWVEIIRCKDCKWYQESDYFKETKFCYRLKDLNDDRIGYNFDDNDFCSYAERRVDE